MAEPLKDATSDVLCMKFPFEFNCSDCGKVETADFCAAFVRSTAGHWLLDLGKEKGIVGISSKSHEYRQLEELVDKYTVTDREVKEAA